VLEHPTVVLGVPRTMLETATKRLERVFANRDKSATELYKCPDCGAVGLPERIENHDCDDFLEARND